MMSLVGEHTLAIYVGHIIPGSGTRIVLSLLGVSNLTVHVILGTVMGVVGPLVLWGVTRRHARWLWALPVPLQRWVGASSRPRQSRFEVG